MSHDPTGLRRLMAASLEVTNTTYDEQQDVMFLGALERLSKARLACRPEALEELVEQCRRLSKAANGGQQIDTMVHVTHVVKALAALEREAT